MKLSSLFTALALIASANAIPKEKLNTLAPISSKSGPKSGPKSCPDYGSSVEFTIVHDSEDNNQNNYSFDGTLYTEDNSPHGFISTGCQKSQFLSSLYGSDAGECVTEIILTDGIHLTGVVTASGTSIFGFLNPGSFLTITGGDVCQLRAKGNIQQQLNKLTINFM